MAFRRQCAHRSRAGRAPSSRTSAAVDGCSPRYRRFVCHVCHHAGDAASSAHSAWFDFVRRPCFGAAAVATAAAGQRFQFAEQLRVDVELGEAAFVAGLRLGADERLRRAARTVTCVRSHWCRVDLPVQVLTQFLAARKAVDLLVRVLQERDQFAAVGAPAVDGRLTSPILGRLRLGRGAGPAVPPGNDRAAGPKPLGHTSRRPGPQAASSRRESAPRAGRSVSRSARTRATKRSRPAVSPIAANARRTPARRCPSAARCSPTTPGAEDCRSGRRPAPGRPPGRADRPPLVGHLRGAATRASNIATGVAELSIVIGPGACFAKTLRSGSAKSRPAPAAGPGGPTPGLRSPCTGPAGCCATKSDGQLRQVEPVEQLEHPRRQRGLVLRPRRVVRSPRRVPAVDDRLRKRPAIGVGRRFLRLGDQSCSRAPTRAPALRPPGCRSTGPRPDHHDRLAIPAVHRCAFVAGRFAGSPAGTAVLGRHVAEDFVFPPDSTSRRLRAALGVQPMVQRHATLRTPPRIRRPNCRR